MLSAQSKKHSKPMPIGRSAYHENGAKERFLTHTPKAEIDYCRACSIPVEKCKGKCNVKALAAKNDRASV